MLIRVYIFNYINTYKSLIAQTFMKLAFKSAQDFFSKRFSMLDKFQAKNQFLGRAMSTSDFDTFSDEQLSLIPNPIYINYFVLKELLADNPEFVVGNKGAREYLRVGLNYVDGDKGLKLDFSANRKNLDSLLAFFGELYDIFPGNERTAWLFGETTEPNRVVRSSSWRPTRVFNTKNIVDEAKLSGRFQNLEYVQPGIGPRANHDKTAYFTFASKDGFAPVAEFCRQHPLEFTEAIITSSETPFPVSIAVQRIKPSWDVDYYSTDFSLNYAPHTLVQICDLADRHLLSG